MKSKKQVYLWGMVLAMLAGLVFFVLNFSSLTFDDAAWESKTRSALISMKQGNIPEAMQSCLEAMRMINGHRVNDIRLVKTYMLLAEIYRRNEEYDQAEEVYVLAVSSCEQFYGAMDLTMVIPLESLANFYYYSKVDYEEVVQLYRRLLEIVMYNDPDNHRDIAIRADNVAQVYQLMEEWEKSEHYHQLTLEHARQNVGIDLQSGQMDLVQYLLTSADFYNSWGKCNKAISLSEEALNLQNKGTESDSLTNKVQDIRLGSVAALDVLGQIYLTCGKYVLAENTYQKAISFLESIRGADHPDLLMRLHGLATAFQLQKKDSGAGECFQRILQIIEKNNLQEYPEIKPLLEASEKFEQHS